MKYSTVGSVLRATQALCLQLCQRETLEQGIAYYSQRFAALPEANQFREVIAQDRDQVGRAFDQAGRWFAELGLACLRWAPAEGIPTPDMEEFLTGKGFEAREYSAMTLVNWPEAPPGDKVRVVPARAARGAYRRTYVDADLPNSPEARAMRAEAYNERLDDPQYDGLVALVGDKPAGSCALYQVGDIALVTDLAVMPGYLDSSVDTALVCHALALARRIAMRRIAAVAAIGGARGFQWFERLGFVPDGKIVEFERPTSSAGRV